MALATLCSGLRRRSSQQQGEALSLTAFVVDHGLRAGSRDEALEVAGFLDALGMLAWRGSLCDAWLQTGFVLD
jgi:hypothetical protein